MHSIHRRLKDTDKPHPQYAIIFGVAAGCSKYFLDGKLRQAGVRKVLPKSEVLKKAFRRAWQLEMVQRAVDDALRSQADDLVIPADLAGALRRKLKNEAISWNQVDGAADRFSGSCHGAVPW
jgi:hypothetical protein